jgi:dihydrofolate reductase
MIARMWHGRIPTVKAAAYREFLRARVIPDYRSAAGNISVRIRERGNGEVALAPGCVLRPRRTRPGTASSRCATLPWRSSAHRPRHSIHRCAGWRRHRTAWDNHQMRPRFSVFIAASLDGFIARADGSIDWLSIHALDQEPNGYDDFIRTVDAIVIGRGTHDTALAFGDWPYGSKRVIVLTHGSRDSRHGEELHAGDPALLLPRLMDCKRVYVDGGNVISQFFAADLIDDVTVGILPIVLGSGIRLFPGGEGEHRLALQRHHVYRSGMVQLEYGVQRSG